MKIRAITTGITLLQSNKERIICRAASFNHMAQERFEQHGYQVQTVRISTQPWEEYAFSSSRHAITREIQSIERMCREEGVFFTSIGTTYDHDLMKMMPWIIENTESTSGSITIADPHTGIDHRAIKCAATAILNISKTTEQGSGNFRFAAIADCPSDIPFFPASYHRGRTCFSIAIECSDLLVKAFSGCRTIEKARKNLTWIMTSELQRIENIALKISQRGKILFKGIDTSPAPSLTRRESIVHAFEKLKLGSFGSPGTVAIAAMITSVLKSVPVRTCGYSGLMLPVLEDFGLARRYGEGAVDVHSLLTYSSVCGTGLDCIPLPGSISVARVRALLYDVASLSLKLRKPLSARLFPVPGRAAGDMTDFRSPYMVDCKIPEVR